MKNRNTLLQTLLCFVLAFGLILPVSVTFYPQFGVNYGVAIKAKSGASWSSPQLLEDLGAIGSSDAMSDLAVDADGDWHIVYRALEGIRYRNKTSTSPEIIVAYSQDYPVFNPSIAVDANGKVHIIYSEGSGGMQDWNVKLYYVTKTTPKLLVVIPGINDDGKMMIERAKSMFRYDGESYLVVPELAQPSEESVRSLINLMAKKAEEKGKDVIVNIDMDLENYTWEFPLPPFINRWKRSVAWAGRMANIVSAAFTEEIPGGVRILYAHSAGGDATYQSILRSGRREPMYDDINILNGRTSARNLRNVLRRSGYDWWQVKVFTNEGDLPATPPLALLRLWLGSISNYDVAKGYAGDAWAHLHSCNITGHSGLRDNINVPATFEVNLSPSSGSPNCTVVSTVEKMMLKDWREP